MLHRDGGPRGSACGSIVVAAAKRFASVDDSRVDGSPASAVVSPSSGRRDFAAATAGLIEGVLDDDDGGAVAHLAAALVEPDVPAPAAQFFAVELLPRLLARELRGSSQRRCARIWLTAIALLERIAREPDPDGGDVDVGVGGGRPRVSPLGVCAVLNDVLPAAATAMLELVASSCGDGLDHQATAAATALFEYVGARLEEAAARDDAIGGDVATRRAPVPSVAASVVAAGDDGGGSRRKKRRRVMDASGSAGRRRPAPAATAVGYFPFPGAAASAAASYFPFPGAPVVNPAEKQEEDDEDDDEEDDDENDEDEADEVSVEERARVDAEARRRRLQSTKRRRADEVASAFFASASSGPTSDAFKLLASCVSCATAIVCVVALAAPVTDSPTGGGGGAFRHMSGATERAREISRHRLQLQRESKRCRAEVEAHATELTRRRFGCGLRSAPNPPVGSFGVAGPGGEIFWGAEGPIPRGAHRVNELWSEPKSRLASAADAACSLLARASRVCSGGGRARRRRAGRPGGGSNGRRAIYSPPRLARWRARRRCSPSRRRRTRRGRSAFPRWSTRS